jgi:dUTP pyrophosphatase
MPTHGAIMNIKVKKTNILARIPTRSNPTDAGADLYSIEDCSIEPQERRIISVGICLEIPEGYYGRIAPRSGLAAKHGVDVLAGVVDSSYRGEIKVVLYNSDKKMPFHIEGGDRIAQIIIEDHFNPEFEESELSDTERGAGGFGSTGS